MIEKSKKQLKGLRLNELEQYFKEIGEPPFRAKQLFNWFYDNLEDDFSLMLNLSKSLREKLLTSAQSRALIRVSGQSSANGTKKHLFETADHFRIESVIIPEEERATLCISTQAGCPLSCAFCATGLMGFKRNLSAGEILDQYCISARELGQEKITNIVFMGMGEPLLNYEATLASLEILTSDLASGLGRKRITLSTSGIAPNIIRLADSGLRVKLALSLHSPFNEIRSRIMPINKKYDLTEVLPAVKYYAEKTKSIITLEYTMLKGINDRPEDLLELRKILKHLSAKINIIPFNSIGHMAPEGISGELRPTGRHEIEKFANNLRQANIRVMVRETQGGDIAAACGQLAAKNEEWK